MGNKCSEFHKAKDPNPTTPNKNICTTYSTYDPNNPQDNSLIIPNNSVSNLKSAYFIDDAICIPNSSIANDTEQNYVKNYCRQIGDRDENGNPEWVASVGENKAKVKGVVQASFSKDKLGVDVDRKCFYNDCERHTNVGTDGCCRLCCGIVGTKAICQRNAFAADPVVCCFLDQACETQNGFPSSCWQTTDRRKTCSPDYRDLSKPNCLEKIKPYCSGDKLFAGQSHWMEAWIPNSGVDVNSGDQGTATVINAEKTNVRFMKQPCMRALARAVYDDSGSVCTWEQFSVLDSFQGLINPAGLTWAQEVLDSILQKYLNEFGSPIGAINQDGYLQSSDFLDFYYNLCKTFPKICEKSLTNFCSQIKAEDLIDRPEAIKWCGCYMPDSQYQSFEKYSINRECTPYCNIQGNIPIASEDFTKSICTQTTCIINDLTIKLAKVVNPDGFNFNQVCNSCGGSKVSKIYEGGNNDSENKVNEKRKFIISADQSTYSQFIPDQYANDIKFWYTIDYPDAAKDQAGDLVVKCNLTVTSDYNPTLPGYVIEDNEATDPFALITLNYTSQATNIAGLTGTLYSITGVKKIIYYSENEFDDKRIMLINGYLQKQYLNNDDTLREDIAKDPEGEYYNEFDVQNQNYPYSGYLGKNYDLPLSYINIYTTNPQDPDLNSNITGDTNLYQNGQVQKQFFTCFSHYAPIIKANATVNDDSKITNDERIDNITQQANTCSCIIDGSTLDIQDAEVRSLNLTQNCGQAACFNNKGNTIDCNTSKTSIIDKEIISVKNSFVQLEENLFKDKRETITLVLVIIFLVLILIWLSVQHRPAKKSKIVQ